MPRPLSGESPNPSLTALPARPAILHVVLRPRYSGVETLVKALLSHHRSQGCRVGLCALLPCEDAFRQDLEALRAEGCVILVPEDELAGIQRVLHVARALREFRPDGVVAHTVIPAAYTRAAALCTGWRIWPRPGRKLAIALQSADNDDYAARVFRWPEKLLTHFADAVITASNESLANYRRRVRHHPNMMRIANGVELRRFREAAARRDAIREGLGLSGLRLVLQVGRLTPVKQQMLSLDAMTPLLRNDTSLRLWFAGLTEEPAYETRLREAIQERNLSAQVSVLGSRTDVPELLAAADLYLMPSTMEAHSVALIEALASGAPVITSDIATFEYAESLPGVRMVGVSDVDALRSAAGSLLQAGLRYDRDLNAYDIIATERAYRAAVAGRFRD